MANQGTRGASPQSKAGLLTELIRSAQLVWRLLNDPRVSTATKLVLPALAIVYLIWPVDLLPDVIPMLGQLDDLAILLLGIRLFIELCPPHIVEQHRDALAGRPGATSADETIEGEYRVIEPDDE